MNKTTMTMGASLLALSLTVACGGEEKSEPAETETASTEMTETHEASDMNTITAA